MGSKPLSKITSTFAFEGLPCEGSMGDVEHCLLSSGVLV